MKNGQFIENYNGAPEMVDQASRQLAAARGTPITWSVAERPVVSAIENLFEENSITGINVVYVPPNG